MTLPLPPVWVFDIECYRNYFLVMMRHVYTGEVVIALEIFNDEYRVVETLRFNESHTYVTFNGNTYDIPMLSYSFTGATNEQLKTLSDTIILQGLKPWHVTEGFGLKLVELDHIDLIEVAPGKASLKTYGGRINSQRLQDLPIDPSATIEAHQLPLMRAYCGNDLQTTADLYLKLLPIIELRIDMGREFGLDLRSKSDAQMAEAIVKSEAEKALGRRVYKPEVNMGLEFSYKAPAWVQFQTPGMQHVLALIQAQTFKLLQADTDKQKRGAVAMPRALSGLHIRIGNGCYKMGIGGLHSTEASVSYCATEALRIIDRDVSSYYPALMIGGNIEPPALLGAFQAIYRGLVRRRVEAKGSGNKLLADGLKIPINGLFGKLLSMYSVMYSPESGLWVTLTGQLAQLMLIEMLHIQGFKVISANTDGLVTLVPSDRYDLFLALVQCWEITTGLSTEEAEYTRLYAKDVNNYVALKPDGSSKLKGLYSKAGLQKNPTGTICVDAVVAHLTTGAPIVQTITGCSDITKFLTVRTVNGGAVYDGQYLGKTVRWYYARGETRHIEYKLNGNKVAKSQGARPMMDMPNGLPNDIDYQWYIDEANSILGDIGG